jgi:hypothetical protein
VAKTTKTNLASFFNRGGPGNVPGSLVHHGPIYRYLAKGLPGSVSQVVFVETSSNCLVSLDCQGQELLEDYKGLVSGLSPSKPDAQLCHYNLPSCQMLKEDGVQMAVGGQSTFTIETKTTGTYLFQRHYDDITGAFRFGGASCSYHTSCVASEHVQNEQRQ